MSNESLGQQFAQFSARTVPHPIHEYDYKPLPASMERHAPGEYQPTLPGMENMLKGEQTHADVFFKHPNAIVKDPDAEWGGEVPGSNWGHESRMNLPDHVEVRTSSLHPTQNWMDDNYINSPPKPPPSLGYHEGGRPLVERVRGQNIVHDGHHRVVRGILAGNKTTEVARWRG
jgi:hypothetical protein